MIFKLSQSTIEKLDYYVYLLIDSRNNEVFYVGKGRGNRINQHLFGALDEKTNETEKIKKIREIQSAGFEVKLVVLRHGLKKEEEAFEVESTIIDLINFLGKDKLTNIVRGHDSEDRGIMNLEDIRIKYESEEAIIKEPVILININNLYRREMTQEEIYEATRKNWRININRVEKIKVSCSVFRGVIREVFIIDKWLPSPEAKGRFMFTGERAPKDVREKYLNKSVLRYWKKGSRYPIKYVNV